MQPAMHNDSPAERLQQSGSAHAHDLTSRSPLLVRWKAARGPLTILSALALLVLGRAPAPAHDSPPGCNGVGVFVNLSRSPGVIVNGGTVTYNISVGNNDDPAASLMACDASNIRVVFYCPGADGQPDLANPMVITSGLALPASPAGTLATLLATKTCVINANPGVTVARALVTMGDQADPPADLNQGFIHIAPAHQPFSRANLVPVALRRPSIRITKNCVGSQREGGVVTINYGGSVTNTGDEVLVGVTVYDVAEGVTNTLISGATLAPGASTNFSGSYVSSSECGPFVDTAYVTASGQETRTVVSDNATANCPAPTHPAIRVTKQCQDAPTFGAPITFNGTVRNSGDVTLRDVRVVDDQVGLLKLIASLAPGAHMDYSGRYTPSGCGPNFTDTVTASGTDVCTGNAVNNSASATCAVPCPPPQICVTKEVTCLLPDGCGAYAKTATGGKRIDDSQCPAFCYRITVRNCGANVPLRNVTVTDDHLDLSGCNFPSNLAPGESASCVISGVTLCENTTNTVTAIGQSALDTQTVTNRDSAVAIVKEIAITCSKFVSSPDDRDPNEHVVRLLDDGRPHAVTFSVRVCNIGDLDLANVTLADPVLVNLGCLLPAPFSLAAGACTNLELCMVTLSCDRLPLTNEVTVTAQVDTSGGVCGYDQNGRPITTASECEAVVLCEKPGACRVTGGGKQPDTLTYPTVRYVTHGGQVGAPVGNAGFDPDSPCIHGRWTHVRHIQGGLMGNFHATSFDSLMCACLGCPEDPTAAGVVGELCNPDNRICGPEPRPAPANKICFSGVGNYTLTSGRRTPRSVLFRVDIEDRSEPGGGHPGGAKPPPDRYRIRIWVLTAAELARLNDPLDRLLNFRQAISCTPGSTTTQDGAPGALGSAVFGQRPPDIDDGGALDRGNHQIHPMIKPCQ